MWKGQGPGKKNLENSGLDSFEKKDKKAELLAWPMKSTKNCQEKNII